MKKKLTEWQKGIEEDLRDLKRVAWKRGYLVMKGELEEKPEPKYRVGDRVIVQTLSGSLYRGRKIKSKITKISDGKYYYWQPLDEGEFYNRLQNSTEGDLESLPPIDLMTREEMLTRLKHPPHKKMYYQYFGDSILRYSSEPNTILRALEVSLEKWERLAKIGREQFEKDNIDLGYSVCALCELFLENATISKCLDSCPLKRENGRCAEEYKDAPLTRNSRDYPAFITACEKMVERLRGEIEKEKEKGGWVEITEEILPIKSAYWKGYAFPYKGEYEDDCVKSTYICGVWRCYVKKEVYEKGVS